MLLPPRSSPCSVRSASATTSTAASPGRPLESDCGASAVNRVHRARDRAGLVGHEVDRERSDVARLHELAKRYGLEAALDVAGDVPGHGGVGESWCDHVDANVAWRKLEREAPRH